MRPDLILGMFRRHRAEYVGSFAILIVASALMSSSFALLAAADSRDVPSAPLSANASAKTLVLFDNARFASTFMIVVAAFVTVLLVAQTIGFVLEGRRREFAQLRLTGATPGQVRVLMLAESFGVGSLSGSIGAVLAIPLVTPYAVLLRSQNNWPAGVAPHLHVEALVGGASFTTAVAVLAASVPAWRVSRSGPVEAMRDLAASRGLFGPTGIALAAFGTAAVVGSMLFIEMEVSYQVSTAVCGAGVVLLASFLVPLIARVVARLAGALSRPFASATGLLASEHANRSVVRASALVMPVVALLAFGAVFGSLAQTGRAESARDLTALRNLHAVVDGLSSQSTLSAIPQVASATVVRRADGWAWADRGDRVDDFPEIMSVDLTTIGRFAHLSVADGNLADVGGRRVAAISGSSRIGDVRSIEAPGGRVVQVKVVATVEPNSFVFGTFLVDADGLAPLGDTIDTTFVDSVPGTTDERLVAAVERAIPSARVWTRSEWIDRTVGESVAHQWSSIATIVGGAAMLAVADLAQATLASVGQRRDELMVLRRVGAARGHVVVAAALEAMLTILTALILTVGVTLAILGHLRAALAAAGAAVGPVTPIGLLLVALSASAAVVLSTAAIGTAVLSLRGDRRRRVRRAPPRPGG